MRSADGLAYVLSEKFQSSVETTTRKWDKEWLRYLSMKNKAYQFYFLDLSDEAHQRLSLTPERIGDLAAEQLYHASLCEDLRPHVWLPGDTLVSKIVLEMGCGPGLFGRLAGRFAEAYIGIDASKFALSIAKLTSPGRCSYVHLGQRRKLAALKNSVDVCVSRHFFIHHNYEDSLWILKLLRDLTKIGGIIQADFYSNPEAYDGKRRLRATDKLSEAYPSALFDFGDEDAARIGDEVGLYCQRIEYRPELETRFVTYGVVK